ncbi:hypothetical protein OHB26_00220 [Nocardia sp. NBC_01503]|uniref:hypothetical protein n=1 Tax=Nocardia sp. NBC_01503 TaxID=2975997 RepID=UPI002E7B7280|nr:hypothetical protein [Nocardia sp. NBC_01503]WTL32740.1 hypothetical protein OHB26_00220 [Nocardia sp. NBC_01503]
MAPRTDRVDLDRPINAETYSPDSSTSSVDVPNSERGSLHPLQINTHRRTGGRLMGTDRGNKRLSSRQQVRVLTPACSLQILGELITTMLRVRPPLHRRHIDLPITAGNQPLKPLICLYHSSFGRILHTGNRPDRQRFGDNLRHCL